MGLPASDHPGHDRGERSAGKERGIYRVHGGFLKRCKLRRCIRRFSDQLDDLPVGIDDRRSSEFSLTFLQRAVYF